jgi:hypothetical protein
MVHVGVQLLAGRQLVRAAAVLASRACYHATVSDAWRDQVYVELFDGDDECRLQVDFGMFHFGSTVESPAILRAWAAFLAETFRTGKFLDEHLGGGRYRHMPDKWIELGQVGGIPVHFLKDGEYDDRYFVRLNLSSGYVHYTLTAKQAEHLVAALDQAVALYGDD